MRNLFFIKQRGEGDDVAGGLPSAVGREAEAARVAAGRIPAARGRPAGDAHREGAAPLPGSPRAGADVAPGAGPGPDGPGPGAPRPGEPNGGVIGDAEEELDDNTLKQILDQLKKQTENSSKGTESPHVEQKTWQEALAELMKNGDLVSFGKTVGHLIFSATDFVIDKASGGKKDFFTEQQKVQAALEQIPSLPGKLKDAIMGAWKKDAAETDERGVEAIRDPGAAAAAPPADGAGAADAAPTPRGPAEVLLYGPAIPAGPGGRAGGARPDAGDDVPAAGPPVRPDRP